MPGWKSTGSTIYVDFGPQFGRPYGSRRQYTDQDIDGTVVVRSDGRGRLAPEPGASVMADASSGPLRVIVALEPA